VGYLKKENAGENLPALKSILRTDYFAAGLYFSITAFNSSRAALACVLTCSGSAESTWL
jgi:hypothetical protein